MTRSYKHTPYNGDRKGKEKKRLANRKVRAWLRAHPDEVLSFADFKRIYEQYDICDYYSTYTWEEYWRREVTLWEKLQKIGINKPYPVKKKIYYKWYKYYRRK